MSPGVNTETVIEISSDDEFECAYVDLKKPKSKGRKCQQQLKDSSVKRCRVNLKPKAEPVLPRKKWEFDKQSLDIRCSSMSPDCKPNCKNVIRNICKNGTVKPLLDVVPKEELAEPEFFKTIQKKTLHTDQNSKQFQSNNNGAKPLFVPPCDLQAHINFCQTRLKVENCCQSLKADEKVTTLTELDLDLFIESLKFKQQSQMLSTLNDYESDNSSVQSESCRRNNNRPKLQRLKDNFTDQSDSPSPDLSSNCDNFSIGNYSQSRDDFVVKNSVPSTDDDDFDFCLTFPKSKLLLLDESSVVSLEEEFDIELPDLDTIEDGSLQELMEILTSAENVDKLENFSSSPRSVRFISSSPIPASVPNQTKTETLFTKGDCSMANVKCHSYLEFPPFLSEPSSNSWLKHCHRDCKAAGASCITKVSQFSLYKVAFVKELFDAFVVITQSASSPKGSKQGIACGKRPRKEVRVIGTSCSLVSSSFRNLTSFKSQSTVSLTATLLKYLSYPMSPRDSLSLHRALKGAACLHPRADALPFNSEMLFQVLETVSKVDKNHQSCSEFLSLDFMVSCLEMEFLVNFQAICLRRMRKTKLCELFSSNSALRNIQRQLSIACEQYDPKDRTLIRILPLLQRLLGIAGAVAIAGVDGVSQVASMLIGEYEACRELSARVVLLESVSFPFHRFVLVRQVLERWRSRGLSHTLRWLLVCDVGSLLDAYLTDRFLSTLGMERMSTEMAEELVILLYTLIESYLHTKKDCLTSSYWEKIKLNEQMENDLDVRSLSLLPGYVDLLQSSLVYHLPAEEKLSRKTNLYLVKLECLADLCIQL